MYEVVDHWNNEKVLYKGTYDDCVKYVLKNNIYQCNYSKLGINKVK